MQVPQRQPRLLQRYIQPSVLAVRGHPGPLATMKIDLYEDQRHNSTQAFAATSVVRYLDKNCIHVPPCEAAWRRVQRPDRELPA